MCVQSCLGGRCEWYAPVRRNTRQSEKRLRPAFIGRSICENKFSLSVQIPAYGLILPERQWKVVCVV
jgi:hypothetical protein